MKTKSYILIMLTAFISVVGVKAQESNRLIVPDLSALAGTTVALPLNMDNTSEIVAVEFDIHIPDGSTLEPNTAKLTNRAADHTVTFRAKGSNIYHCLIYSPTNSSLLGRTGQLMTVNMLVSNAYEVGSQHNFGLTDVVLALRDGSNAITDTSIGTLTMQKGPDLFVTNVTSDKTSYIPGNNAVVSWQVQNIGALATEAGWTEYLSVISSDGVSKLLSTTSYDETITAGAIVSRQVDVQLPAILGLDGEAQFFVEVRPYPSAGESQGLRWNNTGTSENAVVIEKTLTLTLPTGAIQENNSRPISCTLTRSGARTVAETFAITATSDSRVTIPASVTIPAGQSAVYFYVQLADNSILDDSDIIDIVIEGNGYPDVNGQLTIEDNEYPDLKLTSSKSDITEGEAFQLTITTSRISSQPIDVMLTSENSKRFSFPSTVTIPAGETSVTVDVTAIDDEIPSLNLSNAFTASAPRYNKAEVIVILSDNDMPVLELELTPTTVQESSGPIAVAGVLRRTTKTNSKITVKLTDDADGGLYFGNRTLELAKGVEEVHFNFGPVDNAIVDGDRTYTVTAAVWISSCSCDASGESAGYVTAQLNVLDNDGPALNLTSSLSTVKEGGKTILTVNRNTNDTSTPLTVTLNSDYEDGLTFDHSVTIPVGQQSTTLEVTSAANSMQGDSHTVIFTVQSEGYAKGTCFVMVTDQTLPDARISGITADATEAEVGTKVKLTIDVTNDGAAELPAGVAVKVYRRGEGNAVATVYTSEAISIGESLTVNKTITLPTAVGNHGYYAVVNESNTIQELTYNNNTSQNIVIKTIAPFCVTVSTDKAIYQQGERIVITGQLIGNGTANANVDLYVINEGTRQVQQVKTDETGSFTYEWQLYALQSGHFAVGACYNGEGLNTEMATFDVYGLRRAEYNNITCDVICGDTKTGGLWLKNPGNLDLTEVTIEMLSVPETCEAQLNVPSTIGGDQEVQLSYSVKGVSPTVENKWEEIKARVNTKEGVSLDITLYFYCRNAQGKLVASTQRIVTTMNKDNGREYSIQVTNIGRGNTGKISLALPDFIKSLAGSNLPPINQNDTLTIPLYFMPTDDMQLNVPVTGQLGINCENGEGIPISFSITPVSDETGTLVVDVCDEYTYYTEEAPHVEGAEVVVRNPVTGALVTQGKTDETGLFTVILPEGYYKLSVTANKHDSFTDNVYIDPGKEARHTINLSYSAITWDWSVVETEVEDEYKIMTTVTYETNVPKPVVVMNAPEKIALDSIAVGESVVFYVAITNKGLVNAYDVSLKIPEPTSEYYFTLLDNLEPFILAPKTTVFMPVKLTKIAKAASSRRRSPGTTFAACMANFREHHKELCGRDWKDNEGYINIALKVCIAGALFDAISSWPIWGWIGGGGGGGIGTPGGGGGGSYGPDSNSYHITTGNRGLCDPRMAALANAAIDAGVGLALGGPGSAYGAAGNVLGAAYGFAAAGAALAGNGSGLSKAGSFASAVAGCFGPLGTVAGSILGIASSQLSKQEISFGSQMWKAPAHELEETGITWLDSYYERIYPFYEELLLLDKTRMEFFGDSIWLYQDEEEIKKLSDYLMSLDDDVKSIAPESILAYKPVGVSNQQLIAFIERLNNTFSNSQSTNQIDLVLFANDNQKILEIEENAVLAGFESNFDLFKDAYKKLQNDFENASSSSSVCAKIKLEISQKMTMTRQAFRGTLTVTNGNQEGAMQDIKLSINVTNCSTGEVATIHAFEMHTESLDGFTGMQDLGSSWTLAANSTGTATILFIPTRYAAPTEPEEWSFGGTLSYIDPFSGLEVTRELYPVTLTVKPSPELDLTYFMQRDVYGDDPLTLDVVEPTIPAEFALLINNKGNGDAANVKMVTQQPEIIENEKGLHIDFELISSQVNGGEAALSFGQSMANDFGNIPAHSQMYAQWWLTSTVLGHFVDYNVEATHVTSYGNEDLSLLDQVTIKELIHSLELDADDGTKMRGFMVNEIPDANDMPDMLYLTNGETTGVCVASTATYTRLSATEIAVTVQPKETGWNYGNIIDPTHGKGTISSIVRQSDGKEIPLQNFWQTDRTLIDGKDWLYENRLHFADEFVNTTAVTYVITVNPTPDVLLEVTSITGIPENDELAIDPVETVNVTFSKSINPESFTDEDIMMNVQAVKQDASLIGISTEDNKTFALDLSAINEQCGNGYYTITVQTAGITDSEGFTGKDGKMAGWIYFQGGLVKLLTSVYPLESGDVERIMDREVKAYRAPSQSGEQDNAQYGSTVTFKASPKDGYDFTNWTLNGTIVSTEPTFSTQALSDLNIVANFRPRNYKVTIAASENQGVIVGAGTGIYQFGEELKLTATPADGFFFDGWVVDGEIVEDSYETLTIKVTKPTEVQARFVPNYTLGDVNGDGVIDIYDVMAIHARILQGNPTPFNTKAADLNVDGLIDIQDVMNVHKLILNHNRSTLPQKLYMQRFK